MSTAKWQREYCGRDNKQTHICGTDKWKQKTWIVQIMKIQKNATCIWKNKTAKINLKLNRTKIKEISWKMLFGLPVTIKNVLTQNVFVQENLVFVVQPDWKHLVLVLRTFFHQKVHFFVVCTANPPPHTRTATFNNPKRTPLGWYAALEFWYRNLQPHIRT